MEEIILELTAELHNLQTIVIRLFLAFLAGAIIGFERERRNFTSGRGIGAGFRTYSLVCLGACMYALVSQYGFPSEGVTNDPGRVAAQVVAGVSFLGAGTIIQQGGYVRGLTTAAGLWIAAALGLLIGAGMYMTGMIGTVLTYGIFEVNRIYKSFYEKKARHSPTESKESANF